MDNIVIGFSRPKAFFEPFSWLIRIIEGNPIKWCPFSHAYIKYYNPYADRWEIFQASGLKVNFIGSLLFSSEEVIYKEFIVPVSSIGKQKTVQFAVDNLGLPYAVMGIVGFGWVMLMNAFGKKVKNPFSTNSAWFCSQLTETILNEIMCAGDSLDPSTCSPKDLCGFLENKGYQLVSAQ
jgi:hypothetical protein